MELKGLIKPCVIVEVLNKKGEVIKRDCDKFNGFNQNFNRIVSRDFVTDTITVTDVNGNSVTVDWVNADIEAAENDDSYGLVIGSGTTQFSWLDTALESKYDNSVFKHLACSYETFKEIAGLAESPETNQVVRQFTNQSILAKDVNECALYIKAGTSVICVGRHVFSSAYTINAGESIRIRWIFSCR